MDNDSLDLFTAHHRPNPATPGLAADVVIDAGVEHLVFASRPDGGDLELLAVLFLQILLDFEDAFSPVGRSIAQLNRVVIDEQIDRIGADACEDDAVEAGVAQLGGEMTAHGGIGVAARQRRLGSPVAFARPGDHQAGEGSARDDQLILRSERVGALGDLVVEGVDAESAPADVVARQLGRCGTLREFSFG